MHCTTQVKINRILVFEVYKKYMKEHTKIYVKGAEMQQNKGDTL